MLELLLNYQDVFVKLLYEINMEYNIYPSILSTGMREKSKDESLTEYYIALHLFLSTNPDTFQIISEMSDMVLFYNIGLKQLIENIRANYIPLNDDLILQYGKSIASLLFLLYKADKVLFSQAYILGAERIFMQLQMRLGPLNAPLPNSEEENKRINLENNLLKNDLANIKAQYSVLLNKYEDVVNNNSSEREIRKIQYLNNDLNNQILQIQLNYKMIEAELNSYKNEENYNLKGQIHNLESDLEELQKYINQFDNKNWENIFKTFLKGKVISLVGGKFDISSISRAFIIYGAAVNFIDGFSPKSGDFELIEHSDIVFLCTNYLSHSVYYKSKDYSKNIIFQIPTSSKERLLSSIRNYIIKNMEI